MKNLEELEVQIIDSNETLVQQNCVVALQSHGQPLKKKAPLSLIALLLLLLSLKLLLLLLFKKQNINHPR